MAQAIMAGQSKNLKWSSVLSASFSGPTEGFYAPRAPDQSPKLFGLRVTGGTGAAAGVLVEDPEIRLMRSDMLGDTSSPVEIKVTGANSSLTIDLAVESGDLVAKGSQAITNLEIEITDNLGEKL